jgi:DNA-binding transcriptional MerR regulator
MVRKSPEAFRTISEVSEVLDTPAHVLRFWESRFSQIKPVKRGGGRRYYRPQDIDLLRGIRDLLYTEGLTIKGVQKILRERGVRHVVELGHLEPEADPIVNEALAPEEGAPAAGKQPPEPAPAAAAARPQPEPEAEPEPEPRPEPEAEPEMPSWREFPSIHLPRPRHAPAGEQFDLFGLDGHQNRRPFPPDPDQAERAEALRAILAKLVALRKKMAAGLR